MLAWSSFRKYLLTNCTYEKTKPKCIESQLAKGGELYSDTQYFWKYYILNIIYLSNVELTLRSNQNISGKLIQCNLLGEVKVLRKSEETYSILRFASP